MKHKEPKVNKNSLFESGIVELSPLLLGLGLLIVYGITGNATYLNYSSYLCISILVLLIYLFTSLGVHLGFYVHVDLDAQIDFSLLLMYTLYLALNLLLLVLRISFT